jgi:hypothetical protein
MRVTVTWNAWHARLLPTNATQSRTSQKRSRRAHNTLPPKGLGVNVAVEQLSPTLNPEQVKEQVHLMAHADRSRLVSVFIKGNYFVVTPYSDAVQRSELSAVHNPYLYILSIDSVSYQGVIYRVCALSGSLVLAAAWLPSRL